MAYHLINGDYYEALKLWFFGTAELTNGCSGRCTGPTRFRKKLVQGKTSGSGTERARLQTANGGRRSFCKSDAEQQLLSKFGKVGMLSRTGRHSRGHAEIRPLRGEYRSLKRPGFACYDISLNSHGSQKSVSHQETRQEGSRPHTLWFGQILPGTPAFFWRSGTGQISRSRWAMKSRHQRESES